MLVTCCLPCGLAQLHATAVIQSFLRCVSGVSQVCFRCASGVSTVTVCVSRSCSSHSGDSNPVLHIQPCQPEHTSHHGFERVAHTPAAVWEVCYACPAMLCTRLIQLDFDSNASACPQLRSRCGGTLQELPDGHKLQRCADNDVRGKADMYCQVSRYTPA